MRLPRLIALVALIASLTILPAAGAHASAAQPRLSLPCIEAGKLVSVGDCPGTSAPADDACGPGAAATPTADNAALTRLATLCLLNRVRVQNHLKPLKANTALQNAATKYSAQMAAQDFFDHVSPGGSTLVSRVKDTTFLKGVVGAWSLGENIAWGSGDLASPAKIVDAWMHSPPHRHNILTKGFTMIGIGIAPGAPVKGADGATYTTDFGSR